MRSVPEKIALGIIIPAASVISVFITPELNLMQQHFNISMNSISKIMYYYLFGYLLGQSLFALISKRIGHKKTIQIGGTIALLAMLLQVKSFNIGLFSLFLTGRFLTALGLSSGLVCGFSYIKYRFQEREEKNYLSVITVIFTFSIYASIVLSGYLIKHLSLNAVLQSSAFYIVATLISSLFIKSNPKKNRQSTDLEKEIISSKKPLKIITYSFCLSISTIYSYCYATYAPVFLINEYNLTPSQFSNYNLLNLIAVLIGSFLFKRLSAQKKEFGLIFFSMIILFCSSVLYFYILKLSPFYSFIMFIGLSFIINILCGIIYPAASFLCLQVGKCKSTSSAIMNSIKIGMPALAMISVGNYSKNPLISLSVATSLFSLLFIILLFFIISMECKNNFIRDYFLNDFNKNL